MYDTPAFLARLALGTDADARAIRRAYAREVKLIDQEHEAARFQELRDAYEVALRWSAYQAHMAAAGGDDGDTGDASRETQEGPHATDGGGAAAPAGQHSAAGADAPQAALFDPRQLATEAFDAFLATRTALVSEECVDDVAAWSSALRERLASDTLINIDARSYFEAMVAQLLAQGWQSGHHTLLDAASAVFNWGDDRRRLYQFGRVGAMVGQAVDEAFQFRAQALRDYSVQNDILARLRLAQVPDNTHVRRYIPHVERMLAQYPAFMAITANGETVAQWQARHAELPVLEPDDTPEPTLAMAKADSSPFGFGSVMFILILAVNALRVMFDHSSPPPPKGFYPPIVAPAARTGEADDAGGSKPLVHQFSEAQKKDIESHIHYRPSKATPSTLKVGFMVYISATGEVVAVDKREASEDLAFDVAVAKGIRAATTFEAMTVAYKFPLTYTRTFKGRPPARPPSPLQKQQPGSSAANQPTD